VRELRRKKITRIKIVSEEFFCPVFKHKIHCSQLEGTEASELPEERRYEFCITKCSIYERHRGNINKDETGKYCV
jgi:hypothetical protein